VITRPAPEGSRKGARARSAAHTIRTLKGTSVTTLLTLRTTSIRRVAAITALLLLATLAAPALAHDDAAHAPTQRGQALGRSAPGVGAELALVRAATARYHDVEVAVAAGYEPVSPCVEDLGGAGAMGIHYLNPSLIGQLNPTLPQALLYLPAPNGRLRLVGVEYIYPAGQGQLFGQAFTDDVPNVGDDVALHVWLWQANPAGMFAAYNPNLSCPDA